MEFRFLANEGLEKAMHRNQMLQEDARLRAQGVVESLTPEQLAIFRDMMDKASEDGSFAAYMTGVFATMLRIKYPDRCNNCGGIHLDHAEALGIADEAPKEPSAQERIGTIPTQKSAWTQPTLEEAMNEPIEVKPMDNLMENLKLYEVSPVDPMNLFGAVRCDNCGMESVSLEDRMRREPGVEGCSGCQQKAKFG